MPDQNTWWLIILAAEAQILLFALVVFIIFFSVYIICSDCQEGKIAWQYVMGFNGKEIWNVSTKFRIKFVVNILIYAFIYSAFICIEPK